jgi:hypothetical protein
MKHLSLIICIMALLATSVYAQTSTTTPASNPTETPGPTTKASQLDDLKERLATKVAQLRQTQRKAIFGSVKTVSVSTVTVETKTSNVKIELTDDIKIFQMLKGERTKLTQDDLTKGDVVTVFGDYDASLDLLKAKVIFIQGTFPKHVSGIVKDVDQKGFVITLMTPDNQTTTIDVEKSTASVMWVELKGLEKSGFSKIEVGHILHITGSAVPKKENRIAATRIVDLGAITGVTPTPTEEPAASPSASPKTTPKVLVTPKTTPSSTPEP